MVRSIIIARSSTDRHDVSCKSQIAEIEGEARKREEFVVKKLQFPRKRHSDFLEDPDFKDILAEAKQKDKKWNKIWFYDTSRLSRNRMKAQTTKAFFRRHGIEIEFLKIPKTGEEALDNVVEGILETFDQLLSDFSRAGSIRGQKQNIRSGYRAGGRAPYGYQLKKHKIGMNVDNNAIIKTTLEPHPIHFPIIKEYLERRTKGESQGAIISDFEERKIPSPSGNPHWNKASLSAIEENLLVYCGHLVYNRYNRKIDGRYIGGQRYRPEKEWEINKNVHQAVITETQADAIKSQKLPQKTKFPSPRKYLLTSILKCGICGGPMVGDSGFYTCIHKRNHISDCSNSKISSDYMDKKVIVFLKEILLQKTHFTKVIEETKRAYREEIRKTKNDAHRFKLKIQEIDDQVTKLVKLYERGNISPDIIEKRIQELEQEKNDLQRVLDGEKQVRAAIQYAKSELDNKVIRKYIDRFEDLLNESNFELMREFIKTFIARIELWGRKDGKKRGRKVHIYGQIPALTGIAFASPRGLEPLLQDRKS